MHQGTFYRLKSPFEGNDTAWMVVSEDQTQAIAAYYQILNPANAGWLRFKFAGLCEDMLYQVTADGDTGEYYGSQLMYAGLPVDRNRFFKNTGDFASLLFFIKQKIV